MPELPEVEAFRRTVERSLSGRRIVKADTGIFSRTLPAAALENAVLTGTARHGKYLFLLFRDQCLTLHFGLTGHPGLFPNDARIPSGTGFRLDFDSGEKIAVVFGRLPGQAALVRSPGEFTSGKGLGPDFLQMTFRDFEASFSRSRQEIKSRLMNQKVMAGIGNVYSDEMLYQSRVHPRTHASDLSAPEVEALFKKGHEILRAAVHENGDRSRLPSTYLVHHRRKNASCPACRGKIECVTVGGRDAFFCPSCQKLKA